MARNWKHKKWQNQERVIDSMLKWKRLNQLMHNLFDNYFDNCHDKKDQCYFFEKTLRTKS